MPVEVCPIAMRQHETPAAAIICPIGTGEDAFTTFFLLRLSDFSQRKAPSPPSDHNIKPTIGYVEERFPSDGVRMFVTGLDVFFSNVVAP